MPPDVLTSRGQCALMPCKEVIDQYHEFNKIGEGTYGVVYRARNKASGCLVAIKEMKQDPNEEGIQSSTLREISLLLELDHPNVLKLYDVISNCSAGKVSLVLECLDIDLYKLMQKYPLLLPSHPRLVKYYMWQLLSGLDYLHSRRVMHRDLKPQNLLIHLKRNEIKLADFGLARAMGMPVKNLSPEVVTIWYRPPELLLASCCYSAAVDIWSLGCIFYEMTVAKPLFPGLREIDQLSRIFQVLGIPTERSWPGVTELSGYKHVALLPQLQPRPDALAHMLSGSALGSQGLDLLRSLLMPDPCRRPSARLSLHHPYFNDIDAILRDPPALV